MKLSGSCRCRAVRFTLDSHTPIPYQLCYCSICRKTAGGGGYAINIMGDYETLKIAGGDAIGVYRAEIEDETGQCRTSSGQRHFCTRCAAALWLFDETWSALVHPFASAIDTSLPAAPERTHLMLRFKAPWVTPDVKPGDKSFELYPDESIEDWHRSRGLWVD